MPFTITWTSKSFEDITNIYNYLSNRISTETANKIVDEIYKAPSSISYIEQFQVDEYRKDCRRIIIRNYKILYTVINSEIFIIRIFNTLQNPIKSL
jgi:addiction module RelE/StbE family toxin|uniref:type II toxin-antitoxin system RelE/ParE family toxin n=1 Tax=Flavobacterium sp. TaxID=239 RepID=UPI0040493259